MWKASFFAIKCFIIISYVNFSSAEVYHLKNGSLQEGKKISSQKNHVIQIETLTGVIGIPAEEIQSIESLSTLKREYRKLCARFDLKNIRSLSALASWCREKGLYNEMFDLYDRILSLDPGNRVVLDFISEMTGTINYQGINACSSPSVDKGWHILKKVSLAGLTLKKIGAALIESMPIDLLAPLLLKGLKSSRDPIRSLTIEICARRKIPHAVEPLIKICLFDRKEKVREDAQKALVHYQQDGILYPFLRALKSNVKSLRLNALSALATFKDIRAAGALISNLGASMGERPKSAGSARSHVYIGKQTAAVTGFDTNVATRAAIAKPVVSIIQEGALLDVNLLAVSPRRIQASERKKIAHVLRIITGVDYGDDYWVWNEWWRNNRNRILNL